ncbi:alpha/beta fold hydrolase [Azonexus sp.]|uniref:alpha/beta fold hydrolase n=1 Tax=Azonexus sp. TaxID=1872668 RepID=UPI0027BACA7D|nr:alpha/beta hydrolase [Azonexus sp.]
MRPSRSEFLDLPSVRLHIRRWGNPDAPTLFLLHGWMDVSASWQFVVDELQQDWNIIAPDWRGFGPSQWLDRPYFFAEHLGDMMAIFDHYAPTGQLKLAGHSMGGILATLYAGLYPEQVERLISLEGFGIAPTTPDMAGERFRHWLGELKNPPRLHVYADRTAFARRMMKGDPFLSAERADFLSRHLARIGDGTTKGGEHRHGIIWNGDPWHKAMSPYLFRLEESMAIWRQITCPVLWVAGRQSWIVRDFASRPGDWEARRACFADIEEVWIDQADHMLHHDQPKEVAQCIERWFS